MLEKLGGTRARELNSSKSPREKYPLWKKVEVNDWEIIRDKYLSVGYCPETVNIIINSWRPSTKSAYDVYFLEWILMDSSSIVIGGTKPLFPTFRFYCLPDPIECIFIALLTLSDEGTKPLFHFYIFLLETPM